MMKKKRNTAWMLVPLLLLQAWWLYREAEKKGKAKWKWSLWGLTQFPTPAVAFYVIHKWKE